MEVVDGVKDAGVHELALAAPNNAGVFQAVGGAQRKGGALCQMRPMCQVCGREFHPWRSGGMWGARRKLGAMLSV